MNADPPIDEPAGRLPPRVRGYPLAGIVPALWRDPARGLIRLHERAGPVFLAPLPIGTVCFLTSVEAYEAAFRHPPDAIAADGGFEWLIGRPVSGLDGAEHAAMRALLQPPVSGRGSAAMGSVMAGIVRDAVASWHEVSPLEALRVVALATILRAGMGAEPQDLPMLERLYGKYVRALFFPALRFPGSIAGQAVKARGTIDAWLRRRIAEARARGEPGDDLIGVMISAERENVGALGEPEMLDNLRLMVMAGQETTATVMAWILIQLARDPGLWRSLCQAVPRGSPLPCSLQEAAAHALPRAIVNETLRRYNPAWVVPRRVVGDGVEILGHRIPKGTRLMGSPLAIHHLAEHWPEPFAFDATRWLGDESRIPSRAFIPYSAGRHTCLGAAMASLQLTQFVVALASARRRPALVGPADLRPVLLPFPHPSPRIRVRFTEEYET